LEDDTEAISKKPEETKEVEQYLEKLDDKPVVNEKVQFDTPPVATPQQQQETPSVSLTTEQQAVPAKQTEKRHSEKKKNHEDMEDGWESWE